MSWKQRRVLRRKHHTKADNALNKLLRWKLPWDSSRNSGSMTLISPSYNCWPSEIYGYGSGFEAKTMSLTHLGRIRAGVVSNLVVTLADNAFSVEADVTSEWDKNCFLGDKFCFFLFMYKALITTVHKQIHGRSSMLKFHGVWGSVLGKQV